MTNGSDPHEAVWRQFGGALTMLRQSIEACPAELWERPAARMGYWYIGYHALFFVDHDLHPSAVEFTSPWFDEHEYELTDVPPPFENPYSKADILAYLDRCLSKVGEVLEALGRGGSPDLRGGRRLRIPAFEVVLYELRHVQHHAAQMNALLRAEGAEPPRWVRRIEGSGPESGWR